MSRQKKHRISRKRWLTILTTVAVVLVGSFLLIGRLFSQQSTTDHPVVPYTISPVTEGSIASSTLLTGTVKTLREQKVYYDTSKGEISEVYVKAGDQVYAGQHLMQYSTVTAQANYDQAVRALNKVGRQIYELRTNGATTTTTDEDGNTTTVANTSYESQLQDLYDSYADAEQTVNKAQEALNKTLEVSTIDGTVVEVNTSVDPSKTGGQLVIHIVSEGQLQVEGALTEYDMGNMSVNQEVKLTSKVFPDKSWPGRISYISNYPSDTSVSGGTNTSASYPFKVDLTGDASGLKQGFKVNIEVVNTAVSKLAPVGAIVAEADKNYVWVYDRESRKISKVEVTVGRADAVNQEITGGLELNQLVIANPALDFQDGQELPADSVTDASQEGTNGQ